jgi:small subunit ribosomal protein S19
VLALGSALQGQEDPHNKTTTKFIVGAEEEAMARSVKKGPFIDDHLQKKVDTAIAAARSQDDQDLVASLDHHPEFVGLTFAVHNGRKFVTVFVTENMVGHKLGEFAPTRTFHGHVGRQKGQALKPSLWDAPSHARSADPPRTTPSLARAAWSRA